MPVQSIKRLLAQSLLSTWPCFTEAMYLLGAVGGFRYQTLLWKLYTEGRLLIHSCTPAEIDRIADLMKKYKDTPMDLADASLVAVAESCSIQRLFTVDSDFYIYRLAGKRSLEILP